MSSPCGCATTPSDLAATVRGRGPNLSPAAQNYLDRLGLSVDDLFHHVIAVLHDPQYRAANAGALRMEWPRIPLPGWSATGGNCDQRPIRRGGQTDQRRRPGAGSWPRCWTAIPTSPA